MNSPIPDVIDRLAGIAPGSRLDGLRAQRPQARQNAQESYLALFEPDELSGVSLEERFALAVFVAGLHREPEIGAFYAEGLARNNIRPGLDEALALEIARAATQGPYGRYPKGPLSAEDREGLRYSALDAHRELFGGRLAAALEHAHFLVFHPRDAAPARLQALLDASLSTTDIVTLSQLVTFLTFQIRVVAGLRVLDAA
jgi:CMD domain protein